MKRVVEIVVARQVQVDLDVRVHPVSHPYRLDQRRLDDAGRYFPLANCAVSPQCGFASTVEGNDIAMQSQWAKLRLVVDLARQVWGTA